MANNCPQNTFYSIIMTSTANHNHWLQAAIFQNVTQLFKYFFLTQSSLANFNTFI